MTSVNEILLTQAALDGELDAAGMLDFENRLAGNASLAAEYGRLKTLREVMHRELVKPVAPRSLRERIARMAASSITPGQAARPRPGWPWRHPPSSRRDSAALRLGLPCGPLPKTPSLTGTLLADHKRGLLSGQPFDIASSDRHTVNPWFAARFALAPKVVDLAAQGFPLAGGRIFVGHLGHRPGGTFKIPSVFRSRGQSRFWSSRLIPTAMRLPAALAIA